MSREKAIDIDAHMNDPDMERIRRELADTVRRTHAELDEKGEDFQFQKDAEDDAFMPQSDMLKRDSTNRPRGPLSSRAMTERMRAAEQEPLLPPPRYRNQPEGEGVKRPVRQSFDPDREPEAPDDGYISNKGPVSNRAPSGTAIPAPDIGSVQRLEKKLADQQAELDELKTKTGVTVVGDGKKAPGRLAARRVNYDSRYVSVMPPSQCNFYQHFAPSGLEIKKIDTPTQHLITDAKRSNDTSAFIDAVGSTLRDVDIRDLTPEDWFYVLYWHKYNSYNRTPLILTWTSKYGNENKYIIQESDLKYVHPTISAEDYVNNYYSKGIVVPTLREWELLNTDSDLNKEDRDILIRAQYFKGDTIEEKVDNYFNQGETLEALEIVEELKKQVTHGVVHTVDVVDALFDPHKYLKERQDYKSFVDSEAEMYKDTPTIARAYKLESEEVEAEIIILDETLKNGGEVRAEVETQPVRFNALDMFPFL